MTNDQVKELIDNVDFDPLIKKKFKEEIVDKQFSKHVSFLSTPLLSLMMLMTFSQHGELPEKLHIFYRFAFLTLYSWHDGSKEAFKRERKSGLTVDQFEKVFAIFCMISYYEYDVVFEEEKLKSYISRSSKQVDFDFDQNLFIDEAEQAVNLIFREGNVYSFTHRSFQEYFTALALSTYFPNRVIEIFEHISVRMSDSMLAMFYDLNPVIAEENFIIPAYEAQKDLFEKLLRISKPMEFLAQIGYVSNTVSSWHFYPSPNSKRRKRTPTSQFFTAFGNDTKIEKYADTIAVMFQNRYEKEVTPIKSDMPRFSNSFGIINKEINRLLSGLKIDNESMPLRVSFDYRTESATFVISGESPDQIFDYKGLNDSAWHKVATNLALDIKRKMVFAKKIYQETKAKDRLKRVPIEELLGSR